MLDPLARMDNNSLRELIVQQRNFALYASRRTGKTTYVNVEKIF
jgi:hypothetical protein